MTALHLLEWLAIGVDLVGVSVMLIGFSMALARFVPAVVRLSGAQIIEEIQMIRCSLGTYLVFALELMIVSDLIHTVLSHELMDLYFLGGLVAIRTLIGFFLNTLVTLLCHLDGVLASGTYAEDEPEPMPRKRSLLTTALLAGS